MDVRCENCQTEYELDGSRLKPGGVTVKCTACGHMFKVRKRTPTLSGETTRAPRPSSPGAAEDDERIWLIRLEDGEIRTCRELATLQQWIAARDVTRDAEISKTGKKWKKLGDIEEFAKLFDVAENARRSRQSSLPTADADEEQPTQEWPEEVRSGRRHSTAHPRLVPSRNSGPHRAQSGRAPSRPPPAPSEGHSEGSRPVRRRSQAGESEPHVLRPQDRRDSGGSDSEQPEAESGAPEPNAPAQPLAASQTARGVGAVGASAPHATPPPARPAPHSSGSPTGAAGVNGPEVGAGDETPAPEQAGAAPAHGEAEANEARSPGPTPKAGSTERERERRSSSESALEQPPASALGLVASPEQTGKWATEARRFYLDEEGPAGPTGGLARGIPTDDVAFASSGIRKPPGGEPEPVPPPASGGRGGVIAWVVLGLSLVVMAGAGVVLYMFVFRAEGPGASAEASSDAGSSMADAQEHAAVDGGDIPTVDPEALTAAREAVLSGVEDSLEEAAETLEGSDDHLESVVTQSRLHAARAQLLGDRAELELEGEELAREAAEHAGRARELASRARELDRDDVGALVATGNARRLAGQRVRDVRRPLRRAVAEEPDDIDAELALSLVLAEEGRTRQARQRLGELLQRAEAEEPRDPRPRLQLALLELEREEEDAAREHLEKVLTIAPDHEVAKAALEDLDERSAVVAQDDPMPREEDAPESAEPVSYEGFLERANEMAERGRCGEASPLFRRALEVRSTGVEALTGLGYCHLDAQEFASAQARFKQALSASPGYQPALYGVAEGYQQQGLGDRAISAYERYLEKHPKGTRAEMARRQLARLGAREDSSPDAEAEAQQGEDSGAADAEEAEGAKSETDGEKAGDGSGEEGGDGAGEESGGQGEESGEEGEESGEEGESEDEEPSPFLSE